MVMVKNQQGGEESKVLFPTPKSLAKAKFGDVVRFPGIEIDLMVSLDGVSTQWEGDHSTAVNDWYDTVGGNPFPFDLSDVTDAWQTTSGARDTKDVTFDNIVLNIEVHSADTLLFDAIDNLRLDGTETGITRLDAVSDSHSETHQPGTESMNFVIDRIVVALFAP